MVCADRKPGAGASKNLAGPSLCRVHPGPGGLGWAPFPASWPLHGRRSFPPARTL